MCVTEIRDIYTHTDTHTHTYLLQVASPIFPRRGFLAAIPSCVRECVRESVCERECVCER